MHGDGRRRLPRKYFYVAASGRPFGSDFGKARALGLPPAALTTSVQTAAGTCTAHTVTSALVAGGTHQPPGPVCGRYRA